MSSGDDRDSGDLATGNKKGFSGNGKAFKFMELAMGLEPATG
jgi:hypothetical protein